MKERQSYDREFKKKKQSALLQERWKIYQFISDHSARFIIEMMCKEFVNILNANMLISRSMSRKGNCLDNAVAESYFKTIKVELIGGN